MRRRTDRNNFTNRWIESLPVPSKKRAYYYDEKIKGLGLNVQPSGHRSFFWYRKVQGQAVWKTLGDFPELKVEDARAAAETMNGSIAKWKQSGYEIDGRPRFLGKSGDLTHGPDLTLGALLEDYIARRLRSRSKNPDRAVKAANWLFDQHLARWRDRRLGMISRSEVRDLHAKVGEKHKVSANRAVQFLRTLFNWALKVESWKGDNPATRISLYPEASRTRFLLPDELPRFFKSLSLEKNLDLRDFVILSLFTGARRSDVLSMRWEHLDLKRGLWFVPMPKSRVPYTVPLMDEASQILASRRRMFSGEWVFPSTGKSEHLTDLKRSWKGLLKRSKLHGLRIHDLRRTLGSWQAGAGVSLPIIGKTLGHQSGDATQIYAQLHLDPVRAAVKAATKSMLSTSKVSTRKLLRAPDRSS
jgi:integrase